MTGNQHVGAGRQLTAQGRAASGGGGETRHLVISFDRFFVFLSLLTIFMTVLSSSSGQN
jgi:hypothetical protein